MPFFEFRRAAADPSSLCSSGFQGFGGAGIVLDSRLRDCGRQVGRRLFLSFEEQTQILRRFAPLDDRCLGEREWCWIRDCGTVVGKREVCRFLSSEGQPQILRRFAPLDDRALGEEQRLFFVRMTARWGGRMVLDSGSGSVVGHSAVWIFACGSIPPKRSLDGDTPLSPVPN
jgi:hypothetical protein